ncbi:MULTISPECIES: hypothetical protein [unclassified Acinetobacter]|uniref:hypothetical protein n=1 Tax=unclassified Acinetobacter TaxID=196816 RepID=UPI0018AADE2A|nr:MULTISPECIES: hypothetical protein [unclassified Acinetobacter]MBJ9952009.1 hypothetical protein [Acinetobacter baumannii]
MKKISMIVMLMCLVATHVWAVPQVTSREYKLLLQADKFSYANESADVNTYMQQAKNIIAQQINRTVSGSMVLDKQRQIRFYDSPSSCLLNNMGYSFRERIENGASEVTLKFRSFDHYLSNFADLSSPTTGAKTKLEDDITQTATQGFLVGSSKSTTVPNTRTINKFLDIHTHFPKFKETFGISDNQVLSQVGGLTIYERSYRGVSIDLGEFDADVDMSLWYTQVPSTGLKPAVVEVSFKYQDPNANYTNKVVQRAAISFSALKSLSNYNAPSSTQTKTQFVYQYQSNFCS